jgi:serine/threonine-protein kinase
MVARSEVPMLRSLPRAALCLLYTLALACSGGGGNGDGGNLDGSSPGGDGMLGDAAVMTTQDAGPPGPDSFPSTSPWYQDISAAAVASDSGPIISRLQAAPWGSLKIDVSFAILHADASVARRAYTTNSAYYMPDCDLAAVPIPPGGAIENYPLMGYTCGGGDCHLLVYQGTRLYELGVTNIAGGMFDGNPFTGGCLAIWDLTKDVWGGAGTNPYARGEQCTSADAAGFPMAPLILTAADLQSGEIKHALRFTLPNSLIRANSYVHPATHGTGPTGGGASGGPNTMPYGSRLRLKAGTYAGVTSAEGKLIVQALQKYGMFMSDGGSLYISGTADLIGVVGAGAVSSLAATDFEVLDSGAPIPWNGNCVRTQITN